MLGAVGYAMARAFRSFDRTYRSENAFRSRSRASTTPSRPKNLTTYRDPKGRFVLEYPSDWNLSDANGVQVTSIRHGSFARVDILPDCPRFWENLKARLTGTGGRVRFISRNGSRPVHIRGKVHVGDTDIDWNAYAYPLGKHRIVLSLGHAVDSRRSAAIRRYEDGILAAIRRHFRVRTS